MSADVGSIIAYVFYAWVAVSGVALLIWVFRSRQLEKRERALGPTPKLRPGPPNIDLAGLDHVTPPEPPKPPWLVNLQRFQDLEAQAASSNVTDPIEIRDVDVEAAFDSNISVAADIDEELTAEIAPTLVSESPDAAQMEDSDASDENLEPTHIIAELEDLSDGDAVEGMIIDLTDTGDSEADDSEADDSEGDDSEDRGPESVDPPDPQDLDLEHADVDESPETIDLRNEAAPAAEVSVSTDLFSALEGIQLPLDLLPIDAETTAEVEMRRFTFTTSTSTLRAANTELGNELERLGYTIISASAVEDVAHRIRSMDDGTLISETVVMISHPSLPGEAVRISLEIEQPEMASPFLAAGS